MAELKRKDIGGIPPIDIVDAINAGTTIVNATFPFIKDLFMKIKELVSTIQTDKLSTARGKRLAIEQLQVEVNILKAQNELQRKWNSILIKTLQDNNIKISDVDDSEGTPSFEL